MNIIYSPIKSEKFKSKQGLIRIKKRIIEMFFLNINIKKNIKKNLIEIFIRNPRHYMKRRVTTGEEKLIKI